MTEFLSLIQHDSAIFWACVGVMLLIVEVLLIGGFYLSFAASALIVAGLVAIGVAPDGILWKGVIFAALGVILAPIFRTLLRKHLDRTPDINRY